MPSEVAVQTVADALNAVEQRDRERLMNLYHPEIEFRWPPALPYGGTFRGREVIEMSRRFAAIWDPLQRTEEDRRLDPKVIATGEDGRVVVNYRWKGRDGVGRRFETETLADYQVRDGRLTRAQMFHFDLSGMLAFLANAGVTR
jgi:ketosteroid isomerase-like protein